MNHRHCLFIFCLLAVFLKPDQVLSAPHNTPAAVNPCTMVPSIIAQVSAIRGLKVKGPVPCSVKNRDEVAQSLRALVKDKVPENRLELEGQVYKAVGLIPKDFDYVKGLIDLYVSQLGGYYDPAHHYFVMAGWIPAAFQVPVAAHELTHALQDQYFNLGAFTNPSIENGDSLLARSALIEGDATAAMLDYVRKVAGQKPLATEENVANIMLQNLAGGGFSAGLSQVPQPLQLALFFPYTSGLRFAHELLRRGGYKAIDGAFHRPPRSSTEILHPEKYFADNFSITSIDEAELSHGCKIIHRDTIGEFLISALLSQYSADKLLVTQAAAGWAGDRVLLTQCSDGKQFVRWRTAWETAADRAEFLALLKLQGGALQSLSEDPEQGSRYVEILWDVSH